MSSRTITAHGHSFTIEFHGLTGHETDRDNALEAIENALLAMPPAEVADIAAESRAWIENDCQTVITPARIEALQQLGHAAATQGWHRSDSVFISISV